MFDLSTVPTPRKFITGRIIKYFSTNPKGLFAIILLFHIIVSPLTLSIAGSSGKMLLLGTYLMSTGLTYLRFHRVELSEFILEVNQYLQSNYPKFHLILCRIRARGGISNFTPA